MLGQHRHLVSLCHYFPLSFPGNDYNLDLITTCWIIDHLPRFHPAWYPNWIRSGQRKLLHMDLTIIFMNQSCSNFRCQFVRIVFKLITHRDEIQATHVHWIWQRTGKHDYGPNQIQLGTELAFAPISVTVHMFTEHDNGLANMTTKLID